MYNPPNSYNSNANFNKFKATYFNGDIDVSGGHIINRTGNLYLAPNSNIYSSNNRIEFNDISNNIYFHTPLKMYYNNIEYDIGQKLGQIQDLYNKIGTMTYENTSNNFDNIYSSGAINFLDISGIKTNIIPIVNSNTQKLTNITYGGQTTTILGNLVFTNSINNISSVTFSYLSNVQGDIAFSINNLTTTIDNNNIFYLEYFNTLSGKINNSNNILPLSNIFTGLQNTFNNDIKLNGSLILNNSLNLTNSNLEKIQYISTASSDLQSQINAINGVSLSASNVFTSLNRFSNNIRLDSSLIVNNNGTTLTNDNLNRIQYLSGVSSSVSTSITNLNTSVSTLNTKTTKMSYMSVGGINTTTILDGLISQTFSFTGTINNISTSTFGYLSGATSNLQTQINNISGVSLSANNSFTGSNTFANITFTGTLNNIIPAVFSYLSNLSGNIQDQLNNLGGQVNPTGSIIMSPLSTIQTTSGNKYLLCNGQNVSRTTYSTLFTAIGTTFGSGDGSTTYTLPNYQGLFFRGMGSQTINGTTYTGVSVNNAQQDAVQNHTHLPQTGSYLQTTNSSSSTGGYGSQQQNQTHLILLILV